MRFKNSCNLHGLTSPLFQQCSLNRLPGCHAQRYLNNTLRLLQTQLLFHYLCSLRPKPSASYHINPLPHTIKSELFWSKDLHSVTQNAWLRNWLAPRSSADWSPVVYIYLWTVWKRHFYFTLLKTIGNVGSVPKS